MFGTIPIVKSCSLFDFMWRNVLVFIFLDFETAHICYKKTNDKICLQDSGNEHVLWIRAVVKSNFIIITWNKAYCDKENNVILAITESFGSAVKFLLIAALSFFSACFISHCHFRKKKKILHLLSGCWHF